MFLVFEVSILPGCTASFMVSKNVKQTHYGPGKDLCVPGG